MTSGGNNFNPAEPIDRISRTR